MNRNAVALTHVRTPRAHTPTGTATCSDFTCLSSGARARLVDALCSNTSVLTGACGLLDATADAAALVSHRSALKAYAFFLTHILLAAEADCKEAAVHGAPPKVRPRALNEQLARVTPQQAKTQLRRCCAAQRPSVGHVSHDRLPNARLRRASPPPTPLPSALQLHSAWHAH